MPHGKIAPIVDSISALHLDIVAASEKLILLPIALSTEAQLETLINTWKRVAYVRYGCIVH